MFSIGPRNLPENPPDSPISYKWVFDNFMLPDELFVKALRSLETCV